MNKIALSFFDLSCRQLMPWSMNGYDGYAIDIQHEPGRSAHPKIPNLVRVGVDVLKLNTDSIAAMGEIAFASFFPPCTHVAASGCAWFKKKGLRKLIDALELFSFAIELAEKLDCPYFIENPVGTVSTYYRKPDYYFHPYEYAGYLVNEEWRSAEAYTKKTCLWVGGGFVMPEPRPVDPVLGSAMHRLGETKKRAYLRSLSPRGFSKAVFLANAEMGSHV